MSISKKTMGYLDNIKRAPANGANGGGNYMKLQQGENKFRIVGSLDDGGFITGMLGWIEEDGKRIPIRWECDSEAPRKFADKPKGTGAGNYASQTEE